MSAKSKSNAVLFAQVVIIICGIGAVYYTFKPRPPLQLPDFQVQGWLSGKAPEELEGKIVVVDVWASWCVPCLQQLPELVSIKQRYHDRDVRFVGLTAEEVVVAPQVQAVVESLPGMDWPVGYGAATTILNLRHDDYIPEYYLFDRSGLNVWRGHHHTELENALIGVLARDGGSAPSNGDNASEAM